MSNSKTGIFSRTSLRVACAVACVIFIISCGKGSTNAEKEILTVSIEPQRWILEQIVGDRMEVKTLMANGGDPETYEPVFSHLANVRSSLAYFQVGNLGFEMALVKKIEANNPDMRIFSVSDSIDFIHNDADAHGHHDDIDPHTWSSVVNAGIMASNMLRALRQIDPDYAEEYEANYDKLIYRLDSLNQQIREILPDSATFLVWHPSLSYFARDYGLNQIALGAEGREPSVKDVHRLLTAADESDAAVFLIQRDFDRNQVNALISGLKGKINVTEFSQLSYDFDTQLVNIAKAIAAGTAD